MGTDPIKDAELIRKKNYYKRYNKIQKLLQEELLRKFTN